VCLRKILASSKNFYIYVRNCPRRSLEATKLQKYLVTNNLKPANSPKKADYIFVFTCGGFSKAEKESLQTIEKSLKNKNAEIIVTGCLPKINLNKLKPYNVPVVTPENFEKIDRLINAKLPYNQCPDVSNINGVHDLYHGNIIKRIWRKINYIKSEVGFIKLLRSHRTFLNNKSSSKKIKYSSKETFILEIAKGCVGNCSYCAIKLAMPKYKSQPEEKIIKKFKEGLKKNYKNFTLIAGDIGCYGFDINTNLPNLLIKIFKIKADYRLLLIDLNARWFVKYYQELLPILKENSNKIHKIIMPIQSGSDRILKLMNRQYKISQVKKRLIDLNKKVPDLKLETHIMVGFPGETEQDFQKSLDLVNQVHFFKVAVYQYEDRPNTAAFDLSEKIPKEIIKKRVKKLKKEVVTILEN
jgi:tRNA A37 methylthiotransferase MiaB